MSPIHLIWIKYIVDRTCCRSDELFILLLGAFSANEIVVILFVYPMALNYGVVVLTIGAVNYVK